VIAKEMGGDRSGDEDQLVTVVSIFATRRLGRVAARTMRRGRPHDVCVV
jgi:hypothetical protein